MSLLDALPHRCTIGRTTRSNDSMGGNIESIEVEQTDVECWEQQLSASEIMEYEKRGIQITTKIYFVEDPLVSEQHRILITERNGVPCANLDITDDNNPDIVDVSSDTRPDASAGLAILWKVTGSRNTGSTR